MPQTFYYQVEYTKAGKRLTCGHRHSSEAGCGRCLANYGAITGRHNAPAPKVRTHVSYKES